MAGDLKTQIAVGVDGTGVTAGVDGIKKSLDTLGQKAAQVGKQASDGIDSIGTGAAPTAAKVDAATKNMIGSIQRQIAVMEAGSKSGADYYRVLAGQRGIDTGALKPYLDQLDAITAKQKAAQAALQGAPAALNQVGVSAAQTAAALRGVPAQFTDIVTSLQGGQNPLTVLLQQGGQLKDMFGGVGAAARALGGYVLGLVNPYTVAAAAVAALGVAYYQGAQESTAYAKALILSGNVIGKTVGDLQAMAVAISRSTGTQGQAAEALAALASSGKVAGSSMQEVGGAVVSMSRVLGTSVDEAVQTFEKLSDEPAKASAKLNETMHYLNLTTYERIRALEEQGNKEGATALAQTTLANALTGRLQAVEAQAGSLERGWRALAEGAKGAWDAMLGIGRSQSIGDQLSQAQAKLQESQTQAGRGSAFAALYAPAIAKQTQEIAELSRRAFREQENAAAQGEKARTDQAQIGASARVKVLTEEIRTNADKRKKAIADLNNDFKILGKATSGAEYDKLVADINDKFKDPKGAKGAKPKAFQDDAATKYLQDLREQEAALVAQITLGEKLNGVAKKQAEFEQLIADIKGKSQLTAAQKSMLAREDELRAALKSAVLTERIAEIEKSAAEAAVKAAAKRVEAEKNTARAVTGNTVRIADSLDRQREQYDDRLGVVGLGSQAAEELKSRQQVEREYARMQSQFTRQAAENATLEGEAYKQGTRDIAAAREQALGINDAYYTRLRELQGDSSLGAAQALANYRDESANVYKQVEQLTSNAFKGMEDALVTFATTGKLNFKSLADSIISDLIRMQARAAITSAIGGSNGWLSSLLGGGSSTIAGASLSNSFIKDVGLSASGIAPMAKGGVFDSPSLSAYSGRVYDKPQLFAFAKGAGVFGEAGPEAIMPLRRGRDGKLGVAASAEGSGGQGMVFSPVTNIQIDARTDQGAVYEIANRAVADAQESYTEELRRMKVLPQ
jgi:lambda family phage tail tape measure protein